MKKTLPARKLNLKIETIRLLKDNDARRVVGGIPTAGSCVQLCESVTCPPGPSKAPNASCGACLPTATMYPMCGSGVRTCLGN